MKLVFAFLAVATFAVAGCGAAGCSSTAATLATTGGTCSGLSAGATATISVTVCGKCTDSNPGCQAEYRNNQIELAPVVQQCQDNAGCSISGCSTSPTVACDVAIPAGVSGSVPIVIVGATTVNATATVDGSGTSCTL